MRTFGFRNCQRADPFDQAKKLMNFRLVQLQEDILKLFKTRQEKEMMRKTLQQLIDGEGTLQGKIQRMMTIAEQMEIVRHEDFQETIDSFVEENALQYPYRHYDKGYTRYQAEQKKSNLNDQSVQYSRSHNNLTKSITSQNLSSLSHNNPLSSYSSLLSSQCKSRKPSDYQLQHLRRRSQKLSKDSLLSYGDYKDRVDEIQEDDLFSFRTQEAGSPARELKGRKNSGAFDRGTGRSIMYDSPLKVQKTKTLRNSQNKSSKKGSCGVSPKAKKTNYNGSSFMYLPDKSLSINKKAHLSKGKRKPKPEAIQKLYKRIQRRIELSGCVADVIEHSIPSADSNYMLNRIKHELETRSTLSDQILNRLSNISKWH